MTIPEVRNRWLLVLAICLGFVVAGLGMGLVFAPMTTLALQRNHRRRGGLSVGGHQHHPAAGRRPGRGP